MSKTPLAKEREVFDKYIAEWREAHMGKFVLINGEEVVGFFDTIDGAFAEGTKRYGLKDFFIEQILPVGTVNISFLGQAS
ncbi:MAG: hypothetical protein HYW49_14035 [Deltaproteobacteria bacterium]|nr:hypothetical protein [Deltaproteobacteria bacterium]